MRFLPCGMGTNRPVGDQPTEIGGSLANPRPGNKRGKLLHRPDDESAANPGQGCHRSDGSGGVGLRR